jgi:hypothetical protein
MLCHTVEILLTAARSCDCATLMWKQRKTQPTAIAPHHEWAHIRTTRPVGPTSTPLPSLGVSSLDLGRSSERPLSLWRPVSPSPVLCPVWAHRSVAMRRRGFCNAKESPCVLCAAHLDFSHEVGEFLAGFVALLGRFLPRLGPHGSPRGPFYFRAQQGVGFLFGRRAAGNINSIATVEPSGMPRHLPALPRVNVLRCNMPNLSAVPIRQPLAARAAKARPRISWWPDRSRCASTCRSRGFSRASPRRDKARD